MCSQTSFLTSVPKFSHLKNGSYYYIRSGSTVKIKWYRCSASGGVWDSQYWSACYLIKGPKIKAESWQRDRTRNRWDTVVWEPWFLSPYLALCSECPLMEQEGHLAEQGWEWLANTADPRTIWHCLKGIKEVVASSTAQAMQAIGN